MDRFIRSQNVAHYRRLLERVTEKSHREQIIKLLAEERQKQKDAGDFGLVISRIAANFAKLPDPRCRITAR